MEKFILKSKTVQGGILALAPVLLPMLGMSWGADETELLGSTWDAVMQAVGALWIAYARWKDGSKLKLIP